MALVNKNLGDMSAESLQSTTEAAFALRDTFDYDIAESTRAAKAMMDNFGISGEKAFELIATGAQNNLDYSGEMIDSINEYSIQFGKLGFTADDMFNIFQKGADSGAWNLDKVGDAIKEFSIRAIDGSDSTAEGFKSIGLNAAEMTAEFGKGGESAKKAFSETVKALSSIEDPLEKDAAGVALFGTMWEDLGPDVIAQLGDIENSAYSTEDALEEIQDVKYNDLVIQSLLPSLKSLFQGVADVVEMLSPVIAFLADVIQNNLQTALNIVKPIVENFITVFKNVIDFIKNVFAGDWSAAWDNIVNIFKSCFNLIPAIAENVINGAIGLINNLIGGVNKITGKIPGKPIGEIPTIPTISLPRFHTGGIIDFNGDYEAPIMAMDGEMVLTAAQQKRLFDIANGAYAPETMTSGNISNHTDVKIEHKNYFTVRNDRDITYISEELSRQETKDIMSIGGD